MCECETSAVRQTVRLCDRIPSLSSLHIVCFSLGLWSMGTNGFCLSTGKEKETELKNGPPGKKKSVGEGKKRLEENVSN